RAHKLLLCAALLTPLQGCTTLGRQSITDGDVASVRDLLDQGRIGVDTRYDGFNSDWSPLHVAAQYGQIPVAELLLARGARLEQIASIGYTPLAKAAQHGQLDMVKFLVARGANINTATRRGSIISLASAAGHSEVAQFLRQAQARTAGETYQASSPRPVPAAQAPAASSDVDRLPAARNAKKKNAYAVVVGIGKYREKLPAADYADKDAELVGEYLTKVLGYPEENVVVRLNERATRTDLVKYFEEWLRNNVEPGASVFIYYSGHGTPNVKSGEAFLVPYDGDPAFTDSTAYPLKQLYAALDKLPAKDVTVVLDSCFSGAGGRSVLAKGARPMVLTVDKPAEASGKTVVLAASGGDQISNSFEEKGHGLLTYYFLKGLHGEADANKDGGIEMAELFDYLKPNVQRVARKQYNTEQTPQLFGSPAALKAGGRLVENARP
ncbi:MAG: ankyrin repeat domain-containing protein, partial [Elusimicrobia bacterium]|nr:ankyrin repeat domain-containing protein [Elusimicrobiota bacterium]